ncbi:MAG: Fe-S cluster assembly ATPase SufC [Candidatus Aenigmarchaeota archaeon]|nr:Fe-S cluster assembly ATPase SufC [Candidatus Aenigmarchaeota archaeon]
MQTLEIKDLHVSVDGKEILKGIDLIVREGEIHALMGPNGSGKSTLSYAVMGHPRYKIDSGQILFDGKDVTTLKPNERAKLGLFLSFQYPSEIEGVSVANFLRTSLNTLNNGNKLTLQEFRQLLIEKMALLNMDKSFSSRYLNAGFSGGEKKKGEILQLAVLQPRIAILDETDSGLDIDALKTVAEGINTISRQTAMGVLLITHYQRLLNYVKPDYVHILIDGRIVKSGNYELAEHLEEKGYGWTQEENEVAV